MHHVFIVEIKDRLRGGLAFKVPNRWFNKIFNKMRPGLSLSLRSSLANHIYRLINEKSNKED
jgi:hypothetical protein